MTFLVSFFFREISLLSEFSFFSVFISPTTVIFPSSPKFLTDAINSIFGRELE